MSQAATIRQELREMDPEQLKGQLLLYKKEQFNLRFQQATGQFNKPHRVRELRKNIARIQTLLTSLRANPREETHIWGSNKNNYTTFRKQPSREYGAQEQITLIEKKSLRAELKDLASVILLESLKMIENGEFRPQKLAAELGLQTTAQKQLTKLYKATLNKATTRTARQATALLIPYLFAHSRVDIAGILKLLSVTSFFETKIPEQVRQSNLGGLIALLDLYKIPCVLAAEIVDEGSSAFIQLEATTDLTHLLSTDEKIELTQTGEPMEIVIYSAGVGELPEKIADFQLPLVEPNWNRRVELPLGWHQAYVTVNGSTTMLSSRDVA